MDELDATDLLGVTKRLDEPRVVVMVGGTIPPIVPVVAVGGVERQPAILVRATAAYINQLDASHDRNPTSAVDA